MSNEQSIRDELVDRINAELDKWGEGSPSPYAVADAISPVIRRIQAEAWDQAVEEQRLLAPAHEAEVPRNPYRGEAV